MHPLRSGVAARLLSSCLCAITLGACVSAPKETVELAEVVDRQIAAMQESHEKFVRLYYKSLRDRAEEFIATRWTPTFLGNALENPEFKKAFESTLTTSRIDGDKVDVVYKGGDLPAEEKAALLEAVRDVLRIKKGKLGEVMQGFADASRVQIQRKRHELLDPIDEQEAYVLDALRASYADLNRGSAAIKGYLASVVNLSESRDAVLEKAGLLDAQRKIVDIASKASDAAGSALSLAATAEGAVDGFKAAIAAGKAQLKALTGAEGP